MEKELKVIYANQKSFYKKAVVKIDRIEKWKANYISLFSYDTFIIELKEFENGEKIINAFTKNENNLTMTTLKHLNEFMLQNGLERKTKKEWLKVLETQIDYAY